MRSPRQPIWRPLTTRFGECASGRQTCDLAQCVVGDRVAQVDRRSKAIRGAREVREKYGVELVLIPDWLALVGDAADGYPGISGIGAVGAARMLNRYGPIEAFPAELLGANTEQALLFKRLATLRVDASPFRGVDALRWRGPTKRFAAWTRLASRGANSRRARPQVARTHRLRRCAPSQRPASLSQECVSQPESRPSVRTATSDGGCRRLKGTRYAKSSTGACRTRL